MPTVIIFSTPPVLCFARYPQVVSGANASAITCRHSKQRSNGDGANDILCASKPGSEPDSPPVRHAAPAPVVGQAQCRGVRHRRQAVGKCCGHLPGVTASQRGAQGLGVGYHSRRDARADRGAGAGTRGVVRVLCPTWRSSFWILSPCEGFDEWRLPDRYRPLVGEVAQPVLDRSAMGYGLAALRISVPVGSLSSVGTRPYLSSEALMACSVAMLRKGGRAHLGTTSICSAGAGFPLPS